MPIPSTTCCPTGYVYVNNSGYFVDPLTGVTTQVTNYIGHVNVSDCYGQCVQSQSTNVYGNLIEPSDCPCCPDQYVYSQFYGTCIQPVAFCTVCLPVKTTPIPCITCVCDELPPPEPCDTCQENGGGPISFSLNPFVKQCVDCVPQDDTLTKNGKLNCFAPYFLILPNTNTFNLD